MFERISGLSRSGLAVIAGVGLSGHWAALTHAQVTTCQRAFKFDPGFGFTAVGGTPSLTDVAVWDADGSGAQQPKLVLAGGLTRLGNAATNDQIIAFDPATSTWAPVGGGFRPGDGSPTAVAVSPSGELYVAGSMGQLGGTLGGGPQVFVGGIARWDGTQWNPLGTGIQSGFALYDMTFLPNGDLIVAGGFTSAGNVPGTASVARWNGSVWSSMGGGQPSKSYFALSIDRFGDAYVAGRNSSGQGVVDKFAAGIWQQVGPTLSSLVRWIEIDPITDQPIVAGSFLTNEPGLQNFEQTRIARWDGTAWRPLGTGNNVDGLISILADGSIASNFGLGLQIYNRTSNNWSQVSPTLFASGLFPLPDGDVLLSGSFTTIDGQSAPRLVRFGKSKECPYLEAEFNNTGPLNFGWTTSWDGGAGAGVLQANDGFLQGASDSFEAVQAGNQVFFKSSPAWRGDRSGAYGGRLRVVAERFSPFTCNGPTTNTFPDLILEGANVQLFRQSAPAEVLRNRLVFTAPLDNSDGGWRVGSATGPTATAAEFLSVLKNLLSIKIMLNTPKQNPCNNDATYGRTLKLDTVQMFTVPLQTSFDFTRERASGGDVGDTQGWSGDGDTTILNSPSPGVLLSDESPNGPWRNLLVADAGLGNMSEFYGDSIIYKMSTDIIQDNLMLPLVTLVSAFGDELEYYGPQLPGIDSFNLFSVPLSATGYSNGTGWLIVNTTQTPSEQQMRKTLDNLVDIKIRCEFSQTGDTAEFKDYLITTDFSGNVCDSIDFNNDGSLFDPTDVDAFLSVFSEGPCIPANATCNDVDFNNDTSVFDPQDIDSFLSVFSEGPCL
jgi:hypothetical protein